MSDRPNRTSSPSTSSDESTSYKTAIQDYPSPMTIDNLHHSETGTNVTIVSSNFARNNTDSIYSRPDFGNCCCAQSPASTVVSVNITSQPQREQESSSGLVRVPNPDYPWTSPDEYKYVESDQACSEDTDENIKSRESLESEAGSKNRTGKGKETRRMRLVIREDSYEFETITATEKGVEDESKFVKATVIPESVQESSTTFLKNDVVHGQSRSKAVLGNNKTAVDCRAVKENDDHDVVLDKKNSTGIKAYDTFPHNESLTSRSFPPTSPSEELCQESETVRLSQRRIENSEKGMEKQAKAFPRNISQQTKVVEKSRSQISTDPTKEISESKIGLSSHSIKPHKLGKKFKTDDTETDGSTNEAQHVTKEATDDKNQISTTLNRNGPVQRDNGDKHVKRDGSEVVRDKKFKKLAKCVSKLFRMKYRDTSDQDDRKMMESDKPNENTTRYTTRLRKAGRATKEAIKGFVQYVKSCFYGVPSESQNEDTVKAPEPVCDGYDSSVLQPVEHVKSFNETAEKYRQIARQLDLEKKDYAGALKMYERAIDEMKKTDSTANECYGRILFEYGVTLHKVGRRSESKECYGKAALAGFAHIEHDFSQDLTVVRNAECNASESEN